jgi:hypothetical protein
MALEPTKHVNGRM